MVRFLQTRSIRYYAALVGVAALLSVTGSMLPRAPDTAPYHPGQASDMLAQAEPIYIPMPTSDPFIG